MLVQGSIFGFERWIGEGLDDGCTNGCRGRITDNGRLLLGFGLGIDKGSEDNYPKMDHKCLVQS